MNIKFNIQNKIVGILFIFLGFCVLLIGEVNNLDRLYIFDSIYVNQVLIAVTFYFSIFAVFKLKNNLKVLAWLIFLLPISASLIWSNNYYYGIYKLGNLYISSYISLVLFLLAIKLTSLQLFVKTIINILLVLLVITVLFKLKNGFFDRNVMFFLNGPIVFGRLMGIGAMLTLINSDIKHRHILFLVFTISVMWTASKGPILALFFTWLIYFLLKMNFRQKIFSMLILAFIIKVLYDNLIFLSDIGFNRLIDAAFFFFDSGANVSSSSISIRGELMNDTIEVLLNYPFFGVGMGAWAGSVFNQGLIYPHNFFLEVFSESGMLLGGLFCVPYLIFLKNPQSKLFYATFFLLASQQVSGDILDSRYWLIFSLLTLCVFEKYHSKITQSSN